MIKIFAVAAAAATLIAAPAFAQDNSMSTGMTSTTTTTAKPMKHKMHKKHTMKKKSMMSNSMGNNMM